MAFVDFGHSMWLQRVLKPGFRHCLAFAYDRDAQKWIVIDPLLDGAFVRVLDGNQMDALIAIYLQHGRIVHCQAKRKPVRRPRLLLTCVSAIAHLLGINTCAVTPHQLYRYLVRNGATPAFEVD